MCVCVFRWGEAWGERMDAKDMCMDASDMHTHTRARAKLFCVQFLPSDTARKHTRSHINLGTCHTHIHTYTLSSTTAGPQGGDGRGPRQVPAHHLPGACTWMVSRGVTLVSRAIAVVFRTTGRCLYTSTF